MNNLTNCGISFNLPPARPLRRAMRFISTILFFLVFSSGCFSQGGKLVKLEGLQQQIQSEKEQIQVINFWATWCGPCLKELPLFEKLGAERKDLKIKLVSMDMDLDPDPEKVRKFVIRKKLQSEVLILDEQNPDKWIDKIDKAWSGALPATLILNNKNGKRKFVERELHEGDLEKLIAEVQ